MIYLKGFSLGFEWTHCNGESSYTSAILASYHHPKSITWHWALKWIKPNKFRLGGYKTHLYSDGTGSRYLTLPLIGSICFSTQKHMFRS